MADIHVAVGVVINDRREVCISKRPEGTHLAGFWEFPGGKVEASESVAQALARELLEELSLTVESTDPLIALSHRYPDKSVLLDVHIVTSFSGQAIGLEGQEVRWVDLADLSSYEFPEANRQILQALLDQLAE